ncbi:MAG: xanthine dehydrogenase family protein subunit M [Chlamydiae bacterium]|nr:MAG: xanthine dehydrogenase family protein subunit M [Chlamydiota bacterium]
MSNHKSQIFSPHFVYECLSLMEQFPKAKILAGGTDLLVRLKDEMNQHDIIDISHLKELKGISIADDKIKISALTTFSELIENEIIAENADVLVQAAEIIGSSQIRNRGTIGGNIANASPAGDSIPPLFVLEAEIETSGKNGTRIIPIKDFFKGPGRTILKKCEIISSVIIPKNKDYRGAFVRLGQRKSLAISKVSLAALFKVEDERITETRIALGAVAPTVIRASKTEKFLIGKKLNDETISEAEKIICDEVSPISDIRSIAEYRKEMCGELLEQAITRQLF